VLALLLVSAGLIAPGLAGKGPLGSALDPRAFAGVQVREVAATVPGLGSFRLEVAGDHPFIGTFAITLTGFTCGEKVEQGPLEWEGGGYSPIIDGQFTFSLQTSAGDPWQNVIKVLTINGRFDVAGTRVAGTWLVETRGNRCSWNWASS
jgi:hypothetical protein